MVTQRRQQDLAFAYWVPNVSGGLVVSKIKQRTGWDFKYNQKLAQTAEKLGFDYALTQVRFTSGYGAANQHESVTFSQALLAATHRLNIIAAVLPGPWHPVVLAKQIATIANIYDGRIAVNIVSGWFKSEFQAIGEPWLDHDERYRRSEEFINILKGVWTKKSFTYRGDFYRLRDFMLNPKPINKPHPEIFQGGTSLAAKKMAGRVSDWYFTNGNNPQELQREIQEVRALAAAAGRDIKIGVNAFVIARPTEAAAQAVLNDIISQADFSAVHSFAAEVKNAGQAAPEGKGMWVQSTFTDLVQYNDGFKTNLIGTPRQIAKRIITLKEIGVDLVLTGYLHYQEELEFFGREVMPLVRELEKKCAA